MTDIRNPTASSIETLLRATEELHAEAEKRLPKHDWQIWYGTYMAAMLNGDRSCCAVEHADEAILRLTTECDECDALIPDTAKSEVNKFHKTSCSLHPSNVK